MTVLRRMSGCANPFCSACQHNYEDLAQVVALARVTSEPVTATTLKALR